MTAITPVRSESYTDIQELVSQDKAPEEFTPENVARIEDLRAAYKPSANAGIDCTCAIGQAVTPLALELSDKKEFVPIANLALKAGQVGQLSLMLL